MDLLRAPHGGGGKFFVDAGLKDDVVILEMFLGFPQRFVQAPERGAAVAGDESSCVKPRSQIAPALDQRETHQGLDAGEVNAAMVAEVFVFQCDLLHALLLQETAARMGRRSCLRGRR